MHKSSMFPLKFDEKKIIKYMQEEIPILYRPAKGIGPTSYRRQPDINPHAGYFILPYPRPILLPNYRIFGYIA
ncbi:MAG: hypothetical protein N0E48_25430 [Candidatus Thiodiazotropha endolucinida]|nr:hypothetical protein [Candidatus Thiodiazotropha taylori]MCW4346667.1 hypothetical protein [Candidatus Thiodiazotropha endolucinida]